MNTNLEVDAPNHVSAILRNAARLYHEDAAMLESSWQSCDAGKGPWSKTARILERAADQIDKKIK